MDPPVPAAQGKGSWAGSPGVALPGAPDRWAGCTGGCGAAWGWSSGALPGGVLACGCPVRTGPGSPWPLLLPAASPSSMFRVRPQPASPSTRRPCPAAGPVGAEGPEPPGSFPPAVPFAGGTEAGHVHRHPQWTRSPQPSEPRVSGPPGVGRATRVQDGRAPSWGRDRSARTHPSRRVWPAGDPRALSRSAAPQCCSGLAPVPFALRPGADAVAVQRLRGRPGFGTSGGSGCSLLR